MFTQKEKKEIIVKDAVGHLCQHHECQRRWTIQTAEGRYCRWHYPASPEEMSEGVYRVKEDRKKNAELRLVDLLKEDA